MTHSPFIAAGLMAGCAMMFIAIPTARLSAQDLEATQKKPTTEALKTIVELTPAQRAIASAKASLKQQPKNARLWSRLALAQARRARELASHDHYHLADHSLEKALSINPKCFEAHRTKIWVLLGQHEFGRALKAAAKLHKKFPDDLVTLACLTDAQIELGMYSDAERMAQWMLDMRPGNVPGLMRGAYLRELFGDDEGAMMFLTQAYGQIRPSESEDRAWALVQVGHLKRKVGELEAADRAFQLSLAAFPNYHYAIAGRARVALERGDFASATKLFRQHYAQAQHPENLYWVGVALHAEGKKEEAKAAFAEFVKLADGEASGWDNANRELIAYHLEHSGQVQRALELARREASRRQDVFTLHNLAWAQWQAGEVQAAGESMKRALSPGIKEARMLYHAGEIARALGEPDAARVHLKASLELNARALVAPKVRSLLKTLNAD